MFKQVLKQSNLQLKQTRLNNFIKKNQNIFKTDFNKYQIINNQQQQYFNNQNILNYKNAFMFNTNQQNNQINEKNVNQEENEEIEVQEVTVEASLEDFIVEDQDQKGSFIENVQLIEDKNDKDNKYLMKTKYGLLKLIQCDLPDTQIEKIDKIYYLHNTIPTNYMKKILKSDKNSLLVFNPDCNYKNILQMYQSIDKTINEIYFGKPKKPKNPFSKCKTNKEIFNLNRRIQIEKKSLLDKICVLVNSDATLRLKGGSPDVGLMKKFCSIFFKPQTQVIKHDFVIPISSFLGINSADQYEKTGVAIEALKNKKVFPLYGIWPPTQQHYYNLYIEFIKQAKNLFATPRNIIDIGCGTGVLGFIFNQQSQMNQVFAIDKNEDAVKCARLNSQIVDVAESYNAQEMDITQLDFDEQNKMFDAWHFPQKYDLILCNPPWINAKILNKKHTLDNGVYDPNEEVLKSVFSFAQKRLNMIPKKSKKGRLLLLYTDLGEIMELQDKNRIEQLCEQHNLIIQNKFTTTFLSEKEIYRQKKSVDPLVAFKSQAKVILYEITRV